MKIRVTYAGQSKIVDDATDESGAPLWQAAADALIAECGVGRGVPSVERIGGGNGAPAPSEALSAPASAPQSPPSAPASTPAATPSQPGDTDRGDVSQSGKLRSMIDDAAARAAGFAPAQPLYERGTRVVSLGVENAKRFRQEHDAKPTVAEYCADFVEAIRDENRIDVPVRATDLRLTRKGRLASNGDRMLLDPRAFGSLVTRMGIGGSGYLSKCWPELRALNFNHWAKRLREIEDEERSAAIESAQAKGKTPSWSPQELVLRSRRNAKSELREIFGIVTERYTTFDVDKIAEALALASPADARGAVAYDGRRAKFHVGFHSTVQPEHYVAGEFFRAGVIVQTDDAGGGSIIVRAVVEQNLCLNLICLDVSKSDVVRIRHIGSVDQLAEKFREGFNAALGKLDHFLKAWGYASEENVLTRAQAATTVEVPMSIHEALPGLFNAIVERELVPVRGRRTEVVPQLVRMWGEDDSAQAGRPSRGAIVNAFTRYAHVVNQDPWEEEKIQAAAGQLLFGRNGRSPDPLPYLPMEARA